MVRTYSDHHHIYSVDMMFAYVRQHKPKYIRVPVKGLTKQLSYKGWGDPVSKKLYSPVDVLKYPQRYKKDTERIGLADLRYPIILSTDGDIIDGMHRLAKAYQSNVTEIRAYQFSKSLMKKFIIGKRGDWDKIAKMELFDFMNLYIKRFSKHDG